MVWLAGWTVLVKELSATGIIQIMPMCSCAAPGSASITLPEDAIHREANHGQIHLTRR